jgi:hypothetical protein
MAVQHLFIDFKEADDLVGGGRIMYDILIEFL